MSTPDDREAAFIAGVTAGATHELRNVLAIVKESAGLMDDLVRSAGERGAVDPGRLQRSVDRIAKQVARGSEILTSLNRFAHSLEHVPAPLDLGQEVQQAAVLGQRTARQRRHAVEVRAGDADLAIDGNALHLQMALFAALECCMELLPEPGTVVLRAARHGDRPAVELTGEVSGSVVSSDAAAPSWSRLAGLAERLGGSVERVGGSCRLRLVLAARRSA
jgi:C4-dicarboxylate-specific signal transduction histidine kinase